MMFCVFRMNCNALLLSVFVYSTTYLTVAAIPLAISKEQSYVLDNAGKIKNVEDDSDKIYAADGTVNELAFVPETGDGQQVFDSSNSYIEFMPNDGNQISGYDQKRATFSESLGRGFGKRGFETSMARGFGKRNFESQMARGFGKRAFSPQMARGYGKRHFEISHARGFGKR